MAEFNEVVAELVSFMPEDWELQILVSSRGVDIASWDPDGAPVLEKCEVSSPDFEDHVSVLLREIQTAAIDWVSDEDEEDLDDEIDEDDEMDSMLDESEEEAHIDAIVDRLKDPNKTDPN